MSNEKLVRGVEVLLNGVADKKISADAFAGTLASILADCEGQPWEVISSASPLELSNVKTYCLNFGFVELSGNPQQNAVQEVLQRVSDSIYGAYDEKRPKWEIYTLHDKVLVLAKMGNVELIACVLRHATAFVESGIPMTMRSVIRNMCQSVTPFDSLDTAICKLMSMTYTGQWIVHDPDNAFAIQDFIACDAGEANKLQPILHVAAQHSVEETERGNRQVISGVDVETGYMGAGRAVKLSIVVRLDEDVVYTYSNTFTSTTQGTWNFVTAGPDAKYLEAIPDSGDRSRNEPVYLMSAKATRFLLDGTPIEKAIEDIRRVSKQQGWSDVQAFGQQLLFIS